MCSFCKTLYEMKTQSRNMIYDSISTVPPFFCKRVNVDVACVRYEAILSPVMMLIVCCDTPLPKPLLKLQAKNLCQYL